MDIYDVFGPQNNSKRQLMVFHIAEYLRLIDSISPLNEEKIH